MNKKDDFLEYPTISELTEKDKEQYRINHVDVKGLLKRIEELEEENKRISILEQQIEESKNIEKKEPEKKEPKHTPNVINTGKIYKIIAMVLVLTIGLGVWIVNPFKSDTSAASEIQEDNKINVSIGDLIEFGNYEGKAIEWQVLDINEEDNSALLVSKCILFNKAYNDELEDCTWKTSTLRKYLNNEFYTDAFNETEKEKIKEIIVKNPDNEEWGTKGGNDTKDKVFLLSIEEVEQYFKTIEDRKATLTDGESKWYWLRSPGYDSDFAAFVYIGGDVDVGGRGVDNDDMGVRSALWINL